MKKTIVNLLFIFTSVVNAKTLISDSYISNIKPIKKMQPWPMCWAYSSIYSIETSLDQDVNLSEHHMDKYSGFNRDGLQGERTYSWNSGQGAGFLGSNSDDTKSGLIVHIGGSYKIAASYIARNGGVVNSKHERIIDSSDYDKFGNTNKEGVKLYNNYSYYMPQTIEWISKGSNLQKMIKENILKYGSVASSQFMVEDPVSHSLSYNEIHYYFGEEKENHAISLIGWDDNMAFPPLKKGMWIARDSDHRDDLENPLDYFYIPYADKFAGQIESSGNVVFKNISKVNYSNVFFNSLHGWSYAFDETGVKSIKEVLKINSRKISAIGYFSPTQNDKISISIKGCKEVNKEIKEKGYHHIKLECDEIKRSEVEVLMKSQNGVYAYDASKVYDLLLGNNDLNIMKPRLVKSKALRGQSFYFLNNKWNDLYDYNFGREVVSNIEYTRNKTANFAIYLYEEGRLSE